MIKYSKIINEETKLCEIGTGTNSQFYEKIGMILQDVEQSDIDNNWYLVGYAPMYTEEELVEIEKERILNLTITNNKLETGLFNSKGKTFTNIIEQMIEDNWDSLILKQVELELKKEYFVRDNSYIELLTSYLNIPSQNMDKFFDTKDFRYLQ